MKVVFDASSLLNLANGGVLETVLNMKTLAAQIGPQVRDEGQSIAPLIDELIAQGKLTLVSDDDVPASLFLDLMERYQLGPGETECVTLASIGGQIVCCDDRKARTMAQRELGRARITGSLGLLLRAIHDGLMTLEEAFASYELMRRRGGFLPELTFEEFANASDEFKKA